MKLQIYFWHHNFLRSLVLVLEMALYLYDGVYLVMDVEGSKGEAGEPY
jgi:hypothetical protein